MRCFVCAAVICLLSAPLALAQNTSFTVSAGYSNVQFGHTSGLPYERNGGYVDGELLWRVPDLRFPLLLGAGISGSGYSDTERLLVTFPNGFTGFTHLYSDQGLFSIEARAAVPIRIGDRGVFVMPQLGAGLLVDDYAIDTLVSTSGGTFINTEYHDGAAFLLRPGIQAGYSWGWGSVGGELTYMVAWGDFGRLGSRALEFRAGVFFRVKF